MAEPFNETYDYDRYEKDLLCIEMKKIDAAMGSSFFVIEMNKWRKSKFWDEMIKIIRGISYDVDHWARRGRKDEEIRYIGEEVVRIRKLFGLSIEAIPLAREMLGELEFKYNIHNGEYLAFDSFFDKIYSEVEAYNQQQAEQEREEEEQEETVETNFYDSDHGSEQEVSEETEEHREIADSEPIESDYIYDQAIKTLEAMKSQKGMFAIASFRDDRREAAIDIVRMTAEEICQWRMSRQWKKRNTMMASLVGKLTEKGYTSQDAEAAFRLYGDIFVACGIPYQDIYICIGDLQTELFKKEEADARRIREKIEKENQRKEEIEKKLPLESMKFAASVVDPDMENSDWVMAKVMYLHNLQKRGSSLLKHLGIEHETRYDKMKKDAKKEIKSVGDGESLDYPDGNGLLRVRKADEELKSIIRELEENDFSYSRSLRAYNSRNWGFDAIPENLENGYKYKQGFGYHPDNLIKRGLFLECCLDVEFMLDKKKLTFKDFMETMFHEDVIHDHRVFVAPPGSGKDIMLRWYCLNMDHDSEEKLVFQFRTLSDLDKFYFDLMAERAIGRLKKDVTVLPLTARHTYSEKAIQEADILLTTHQRIIGEAPRTVYQARIGGSKEKGRTRFVKRVIFINELPPTHVRYTLKNEERFVILNAAEILADGGRDALLHAWKEDKKDNILPMEKDSHLRKKCSELSARAFSICCEEDDIFQAATAKVTEGKTTKKQERTKQKIKKLEEKKKQGKSLKYTGADAMNAEAYFATISKAVKGSSSSATPLSKSAGRRRFALFGGIIASQVIAAVFEKDRDFSPMPLSRLEKSRDVTGMATYELKLNIPDPVYFPFDELSDYPICIIDGTGDITFKGSKKFKVVKPHSDAVKRVLSLSDKINIIPGTTTDRRVRKEENFLKMMEKYDIVIQKIRSTCTADDPGLVLTLQTLKLKFLKNATRDESEAWKRYQRVDLQPYIQGKAFNLAKYLKARINQGLERPICDVIYYQSGMERSTSRFQDVRHLFYVTEFFQNKAAWKLHKKSAQMEEEGIKITSEGKELDMSLLYPSVAAMVQCYYRTAARKVDESWEDIKKGIILDQKTEEERANKIYPELWYEGKHTIPHQDILIDVLDGVSCYDISKTTEYLEARKKVLRKEHENAADTDKRGIHIYFTEDFADKNMMNRDSDSMIGSFLSAFDEVRYKGQETEFYRIWDESAMRIKYGLKHSVERRDSYNRYCSLLLETDILSGSLFNSESLGLQSELTGKPIRNSALSNGIMRVLSHLAESSHEPFVLLQNQKRGKNARFLIVKEERVVEKTNTLDDYGNIFHVVKDPTGKNYLQDPDRYPDVIEEKYCSEALDALYDGRKAMEKASELQEEDDEYLLRMENPKESVSELLRELIQAGALKSFLDTPLDSSDDWRPSITRKEEKFRNMKSIRVRG